MNQRREIFEPLNDCFLFLDMNSYFARCEQQLNHKLQNRPIVVAPYTGPTGCCIAVSYEAKALGIKTGMGVGDAKRIFPQLVVVESRPDVYRAIHKRIVKIISGFSPWPDVQSIDEMALPLEPRERGDDRPFLIGERIKKSFRHELGSFLTASIGIGPNKFLAKQAAEMKKPDGLSILRLEDIFNWLSAKKLTDLTGIAGRMEMQLNLAGIFKPLDLYLTDPEILRLKLGIAGEYWYLRLHGYCFQEKEIPTRSIGHSCVLPPEARDWTTAHRILQKLTERAGVRLRKNHLSGRHVHLSVRFIGSGGWGGHLRTPPFQDSFSFLQYINLLWERAPKHYRPILIAISATDLFISPGEQLKLFPNKDRQARLSPVVDLINGRYGDWTVKPASLVNAEGYAPSRIAFGRAGFEVDN